MRKGYLCLGVWLLLLDWLVFTEPTYSHHPGTVFTSFGTATIDGIMASGEWDSASRIDFLANVPANDGGGTTPAALFVMNDETNLYLALVIKRASFGGATNPVFEFDTNHNGVIEEGDEGFGMSVGIFSSANFGDFFRTTQPPCLPGSLCGLADIDFGGTNDGTTAASNDGQFTVIEFARPLNSGDAHDFSVQAGDRLGFMLSLRLFALDPQCNTCLADTYFPSLSPALFGDIVIAPTVQLTVAKVGTGSGTVSSSVGIINCGTICEDIYGPGAEVSLTAVPIADSVFAGWSGCDSVTDNHCNVTMDGDLAVTAFFVTPLFSSGSNPPEGEVGVAYNFDLPIGGGMPPYHVTIIRGSLPPGLDLESPKITGIPAATKAANFTIRVTDQLGAVLTRSFRMKVVKELNISTDALKSGTVGRRYQANLKSTGGQKPYVLSLISGQLPSGLTFDAATGKISGIPTVAGSTNLIFQVTDPLGGVSQKTLTLTVN